MKPIELYAWPTPNGYKISILCEELGVPYTVHSVDITANEQFSPDFLKISPNNKIPAILDHDGPGGNAISLFESGAIMLYLAEKSGKFWPALFRDRCNMQQWLMFQMAGFGPMLGQAHHFRIFAPEQVPYAINRYTNEAKRLYGVMDKQLGLHAFLAGEYGLADMACFPWARLHERQGVDIAQFSNVGRWLDVIASRPAVQRGLELLKDKVRR